MPELGPDLPSATHSTYRRLSAIPGRSARGVLRLLRPGVRLGPLRPERGHLRRTRGRRNVAPPASRFRESTICVAVSFVHLRQGSEGPHPVGEVVGIFRNPVINRNSVLSIPRLLVIGLLHPASVTALPSTGPPPERLTRGEFAWLVI